MDEDVYVDEDVFLVVHFFKPVFVSMELSAIISTTAPETACSIDTQILMLSFFDVTYDDASN